MRLALLALLIATGTALAGDRPGQIVIEPKKPNQPKADPIGPAPAVYKGTDPQRPGFIVISPSAKVAATLSTLLPDPKPTSSVEIRDGIPTITIVGTRNQKPTMPGELPMPTPVPGGKPDPAKPKPSNKPEDGKILHESYDASYCRGCKVGYQHVVVRQHVVDDRVLIYGVKKFVLQVARFGQPVETSVEESTVETEDGKVLSTSFRQSLGKNQMLELVGKVTDKGLEVAIKNAGQEMKETVKWAEGVVGIGREATLLKDVKLKPGMSLEFPMYSGQINSTCTFKLTTKGTEEIAIDGGAPKKVLRLVQEMKPIGEFQLPPVTLYVDPETHEPIAMESELAPLGGKVTAKRTTREIAIAKPAKYLDLGDVQSIPLEKPIPGLHASDAKTFRFQLESDLKPEKVFPADARQAIANADAAKKTFELVVTPIRKPPAKPNIELAPPGKEYLVENYYLDWNNALVKKHAAAAVENLPQNASDWDKARAVESWVRKSVKQVEYSQTMASCSTVAKELTGDCSEHAMLAAGMCRALGIPSKTALGLVYAENRDGKAFLAYHMWYEVWTDSGWMALDAIMGLGSVGPGHLKIAESHWDGEKGMTPLLPVLNVLMARPKVLSLK